MKKYVITLFILSQLIIPNSVVAQAESAPPAASDIKSVTEVILNNEAIDPTKGQFADLGAVISTLIPSLLILAGLILLGMLIMGGFNMMTAGTDTKKADAGKARITSAIIGFVIIFAAYWIVQILEIVFGVKILTPPPSGP